MGYDINAWSQPDYDDWGYDDYWLIEDWQRWYDEMEKAFGGAEAGRKWLEAWHKQSAGANPLFGWNMSKIEAWAKAKGLWTNKSGYSGIREKDEVFVAPSVQNQGQVVTNPTTGQQTQAGVQTDIEVLKKEREEDVKGKLTWLYASLGVLALGLGLTYFIIKRKTRQ
jgi:hypothetical protein